MLLKHTTRRNDLFQSEKVWFYLDLKEKIWTKQKKSTKKSLKSPQKQTNKAINPKTTKKPTSKRTPTPNKTESSNVQSLYKFELENYLCWKKILILNLMYKSLHILHSGYWIPKRSFSYLPLATRAFIKCWSHVLHGQCKNLYFAPLLSPPPCGSGFDKSGPSDGLDI